MLKPIPKEELRLRIRLEKWQWLAKSRRKQVKELKEQYDILHG